MVTDPAVTGEWLASLGTAVREKVSADGPRLVMRSRSLMRGSGPPAPNNREEGEAVAVALSAAARSSCPAPVCWIREGAPFTPSTGVVVLMSRERYWSTVRPGRALFRTAAAPATMGVEKLVPF